jgi:hypothetical protein
VIPFFPRLRPDELLYSAIARYGRAMGYGDCRQVSDDLFGLRSISAVFELPTHIRRLVYRFVPGHRWSAECLVRAHTAYPYYAWCAPPPHASRAFDSMLDDGGSSPYHLLGVRPSGVPRQAHLLACAHCAREDLAQCGEAGWRRSHQMPGVVLCPDHETPLLRAPVERAGRDRLLYIALTPSLLAAAEKIVVAPSTRAALLKLSRETRWLCDRGTPDDAPSANDTIKSRRRSNGHRAESPWFEPQIGPLVLTEVYRDRLGELGWARSSEKLWTEEWLDQVYTDSLAELAERFCGTMRTTRRGKWLDGWLYGLVRRRHRAQSPLRHLFLWQFLGLSGLEVFCRAEDAKRSIFRSRGVTVVWPTEPPTLAGARGSQPDDPRADGRIVQIGATYACLNPLCQATAQITGMHRTDRALDALPGARILTVACKGCGYVATVRSDKPTARRHRKLVNPGRLWEAALKRFCKEVNLSLQEIARRLDVDPMTVQRHALRLGCWRDAWKRRVSHEPRRAPKKQLVLAGHRDNWLQVRRDYPDASREVLRSKARQSYRYLIQHDRRWLDRNRPLSRAHRGGARVDWRQRDRMTLAAARTAFKRLNGNDSAHRPSRITVAALARESGFFTLITMAADKLPRTIRWIRSVRDSQVSYGRRRLLWSCNRCFADQCVPTKSALCRLAGIGTGLARELAREIEAGIRRLERQLLGGSPLKTTKGRAA